MEAIAETVEAPAPAAPPVGKPLRSLLSRTDVEQLALQRKLERDQLKQKLAELEAKQQPTIHRAEEAEREVELLRADIVELERALGRAVALAERLQAAQHRSAKKEN